MTYSSHTMTEAETTAIKFFNQYAEATKTGDTETAEMLWSAMVDGDAPAANATAAEAQIIAGRMIVNHFMGL